MIPVEGPELEENVIAAVPRILLDAHLTIG